MSDTGPSLALKDIKALFAAMRETMVSNRDYLIELDGVMGDGDLGLTMSSAFSAAAADIAEMEETDLGKVFIKGGMSMAKAAPSTMGTLMGTGFMRGGRAVKEKTELSLADMAVFWRAFVEGLMERGKAKPGDKTIIDALDPAAAALERAAAAGKSLSEGFAEANAAAREGLEKTKTMAAQFGRMAYNQEKSRDKIDPGAVAGSLLIKTFLDITSAL
ncbi:MAG: dihydroxyacetone kinase subunit L [Treponema sp.]|jgi:dihydroxyacetone kinase-like protein|nr:dihydroxyacetone kinase subunit L [Treponema sp.]